MQFNLVRADLERYFFNIPLPCPYNLPHQAVYRQALMGRIPEPIMERFMATGYRRSGNSLYTMNCQTCGSCVPIRLDPRAFVPNRSQRRALLSNRDVTTEIGAVEASDETLQLCDAFLKSRYPGRGNSAEEYYYGFFATTMADSFEIRYRVEGRLVGVTIIDVGNSWLNAVYFFFAPEESRRSLGTFNVLTLVDQCRQWQIDHLYLGYWIKEVQAMRYKANFKPHQLLTDGSWQTIGTPPQPLPPDHHRP